jgi:hypothetical protein
VVGVFDNGISAQELFAMTPFNGTPPILSAPIKPSSADLFQLALLVDKMGWEEFMYHVGNLLDKEYQEAAGPHKGALKAGRDVIWLFVNSFHYCDPQNAARLNEEIRKAGDKQAGESPSPPRRGASTRCGLCGTGGSEATQRRASSRRQRPSGNSLATTALPHL